MSNFQASSMDIALVWRYTPWTCNMYVIVLVLRWSRGALIVIGMVTLKSHQYKINIFELFLLVFS